MRRAPAAFTLVELLTVIAIVGILAAILIPVIGRARTSAQTARCTANLRVVFQAINLFAADHQGYYPAGRFHATASDPSKGRRNTANWEEELKPYIGTNIRSVAASTDGQLSRFAICSEGWTGMNCALVIGTDSNGSDITSLDYQYKPAIIQKPAKHIFLGDSDDYHLGLWLTMQPDENGKYVSGDPVRHGGKANYLFYDGHIQILRLAEAVPLLR